MGFRGRNNCMFFYSPITSLGGKNELQTALAICKGFDLIVVGRHVGNDLLNLNKVIEASKKSNPTQKWYGYVSFGSVGSGDAASQSDAWMSESPPSSGLIDGIFVDEFGHDFPSGTRTQQNGIVDYIHNELTDGSTTGFPVFVNPWVPTDVFGQPPGNANNAPASVGSGTQYKDIVLVESFLLQVSAASGTPARGDWTRDRGRIEYFLDQRDNENKNIEVCAMIGAGVGTGLGSVEQIDETIYKDALKYLEERGCNYVCVNHGDLGATSLSFFVQHVRDIFPLPIPSGSYGLSKH
jgi:hypothetical protein